jgi:hypothetical protein
MIGQISYSYSLFSSPSFFVPGSTLNHSFDSWKDVFFLFFFLKKKEDNIVTSFVMKSYLSSFHTFEEAMKSLFFLKTKKK